MEGSNSVGWPGFMTVFAVSGSVALLAFQLQKRLLSDFMDKLELEFGSQREHPKKKVRFSEEVKEPSSKGSEYRKKHLSKPPTIVAPAAGIGGDHSHNHHHRHHKLKDMHTTMPLNWRVLYKGIIEYRALKGHIY